MAAAGTDELVDGLDPYDCPACLDRGDACDFHAGFAEGWDACAAFVADAIDDDQGDDVDLLVDTRGGA